MSRIVIGYAVFAFYLAVTSSADARVVNAVHSGTNVSGTPQILYEVSNNDVPFIKNRIHTLTGAAQSTVDGVSPWYLRSVTATPKPAANMPFPPYLVGGDMVRIDNENRSVTNYQLTITTNCPSYVYLILDNRYTGDTTGSKTTYTDPYLVNLTAWVANNGWVRMNTGNNALPEAPNAPDYVGLDDDNDGMLNEYAAIYRNVTEPIAGSDPNYSITLGAVGRSYDMYTVIVFPAMEADIVEDNVVDFQDLVLMADQWLVPQGSIANIAGNSAVNLDDFSMLAWQWQADNRRPPIVPLPRVSVVKNDPDPRLMRNGQEFRLAGTNQRYDSTSDNPATNFGYNPFQLEADLAYMEEAGYNAIRYSVYNAAIGYPVRPAPTSALNAAYLNVIKDVLTRANRHNVYVMLLPTYIPFNDYYYGYHGGADSTKFGGYNMFYMAPGMVDAKELYLKTLLDAIKSWYDGKLLSTVLAYEMENEVNLKSYENPFVWTSGQVTTADGISYNMASAASRQLCMDESINFWFTKMRNAIRSKDSQALVMMSVFTYKAADKEYLAGAGLLPLNLTRNDWPARPLKVINGTDIDFMDVHLYDVHGTMSSQLTSSEYSSWPAGKIPLICGEFGAHKSLYGSAAAAAQPMQNWRNQMKHDYGFKGAFFWVLDSDWVRNDGWWNLKDENGIINNYLSPNGLGWDY